MPDCRIIDWFAQKMGEIRKFIGETDDTETLTLLGQVRDDLEDSRRRHRENCPNCFGWPTYGDPSDPALVAKLGGDPGDLIRYKSDRARSRRETTRCRKH